MKINKFDIITIVVLAGGLILLNGLELTPSLSKFALIPLLATYFWGKYTANKNQ